MQYKSLKICLAFALVLFCKPVSAEEDSSQLTSDLSDSFNTSGYEFSNIRDPFITTDDLFSQDRVYTSFLYGRTYTPLNQLKTSTGKEFRFKEGMSIFSRDAQKYATGYFIQQNIGYSFLSIFDLNIGAMFSGSKLSLNQQQLDSGSEAYVVNLDEKSTSQAVILSANIHFITSKPVLGVSFSPYIGLGSGLNRTERESKGTMREVREYRFNYFSTPGFRDIDIRKNYEFHGTKTFYSVPLLTDVGLSISSSPYEPIVVSAEMGVRLYMESLAYLREDLSFYFGAKLAY